MNYKVIYDTKEYKIVQKSTKGHKRTQNYTKEHKLVCPLNLASQRFTHKQYLITDNHFILDKTG